MPATRSDNPVPRLSNRIRREKEASRRKNDACRSFVQMSSTFETEPGTQTQVEGPVAQHLVGDRDLAALRVARLRPVHVDSFRFRACMGKWRDG